MSEERDSTGSRGQGSTSNTGTANGEVLAESMAALARELQQNDYPDTMLAAIVAAAVAMVPGVEEGSISAVAHRRQVSSVAPTGDLPRKVDAIQTEVQQGPCLDALYEQQTVRVSNMAAEDRWPLFARRAAELGAASMLSLQLFVEDDNLGALNLYGRTPDAFTDESEQVGLLFAAHAAVAYAGVRKEAHLAQALANRDAIGQAKGILMERYGISADRAFLVLTRASQNSNRKLRDVAEELARTGTILGTQASAATAGGDGTKSV